jgi:hypothetical protein
MLGPAGRPCLQAHAWATGGILCSEFPPFDVTQGQDAQLPTGHGRIEGYSLLSIEGLSGIKSSGFLFA